MALFRSVQTSFWTDVKITEDFSPEDRYFYLYLFTNPHTNLCGCYEVSINQISNEAGFPADKVKRLLEKFSNTYTVVKYSGETRELLLVNWHKYNWNTSNKLRTAVKNEIDEIKCDEFREYLTSVFNDEDTVSDIKKYGIDSNSNTDTVTDTETDSEPKKKVRVAFTPPTVEDVRAYCQERNNGLDAERFVDFYASKGWMIGKDKMKDWKAAVRTWEKIRNERQPQPTIVRPNNQFQQFEQRQYTPDDMAELERRKLGVK